MKRNLMDDFMNAEPRMLATLLVLLAGERLKAMIETEGTLTLSLNQPAKQRHAEIDTDIFIYLVAEHIDKCDWEKIHQMNKRIEERLREGWNLSGSNTTALYVDPDVPARGYMAYREMRWIRDVEPVEETE